jgi:hypothetical protein
VAFSRPWKRRFVIDWRDDSSISSHTLSSWRGRSLLRARIARSEGEDVVVWTRRLRAMTSEEGYRGVSMAHLWSVVEDPGAKCLARESTQR